MEILQFIIRENAFINDLYAYKHKIYEMTHDRPRQNKEKYILFKCCSRVLFVYKNPFFQSGKGLKNVFAFSHNKI